eukprot:16344-Hanusia_phi.AAC.1
MGSVPDAPVWAAGGEVDQEADEVGPLLHVHGEALLVELGAEVDVDPAALSQGEHAVAGLEVHEVERLLAARLGADTEVHAQDDLPLVILALLLEVVEAVGVEHDAPLGHVQGELRVVVLPLDDGIHSPARGGHGQEGEEVVLCLHGGLDPQHVVDVDHGRGPVHELQLSRGVLVLLAGVPADKGAHHHEPQAAAARSHLQELAGTLRVLEIRVTEEHIHGHPHLVQHGLLHVEVEAHVREDHLRAIRRHLRAHQEGDVPQVHALLAVAEQVVGAGAAALGGIALAHLRHGLLLLQAHGEVTHDVREGVQSHGEDLDLLDDHDVGVGVGLRRVVRLEVQPHHRQRLDHLDVGEEAVRGVGLHLLLLELKRLQRDRQPEGAPLLHQGDEVVADVPLVLLAPLRLVKRPDEQLPGVVLPDGHVAQEARVLPGLPAHQGCLPPARAQGCHHGEVARQRLHLLARLRRTPQLLRGEHRLLAVHRVDADGDHAGERLLAVLQVGEWEAGRPQVARMQQWL